MVEFLPGFCLSYNESHWSNQVETLRLLEQVIKLYIDKTKEELHLSIKMKTLLIWDAFGAQLLNLVTDALEAMDIVTVMVPNM